MKIVPTSRHFVFSALTCAALLSVCSVSAAPFAVPKAELPPQVTFSEVASFTPVNGLSINGFTFSENLPTALTAPSGDGPGNTNNISGAMALSGVPPTAAYILSVSLATPALSFGFGYSLQSFANIADAVTLTLFSGATNLGSLVFAGAPDPVFTGGFAGVGNNAFFDRVEITFNAGTTGFALDNFAATVPESGGTLLMLLGSVAPLGFLSLFRRRSPESPKIG